LCECQTFSTFLLSELDASLELTSDSFLHPLNPSRSNSVFDSFASEFPDIALLRPLASHFASFTALVLFILVRSLFSDLFHALSRLRSFPTLVLSLLNFLHPLLFSSHHPPKGSLLFIVLSTLLASCTPDPLNHHLENQQQQQQLPFFPFILLLSFVLLASTGLSRFPLGIATLLMDSVDLPHLALLVLEPGALVLTIVWVVRIGRRGGASGEREALCGFGRERGEEMV